MARKSIFDTKIKNKRRADIISITSPTAFKSSIRELRKGKYTLGDYRALILAQNRAKAALNRKDLSPKERKQMKAISEVKIPKHTHKWIAGKMIYLSSGNSIWKRGHFARIKK